MSNEFNVFEIDYILGSISDIDRFNYKYFPNKETFEREPPYIFLRKELSHKIQENIKNWDSYAKLHNLRHLHILSESLYFDDVSKKYYSSIKDWVDDYDPTTTLDDILYGKRDMYPGVWFCGLNYVLKKLDYILDDLSIYHPSKKRKLDEEFNYVQV